MDLGISEVRMIAGDDGPEFGIGVIAALGAAWWVVTLVIPWPNADNTGLLKHAVWFVWTFTGHREIFSSFLPTAYLASWVVNFFYLLEAGAWLTGG
jgi:hypothetical protein